MRVVELGRDRRIDITYRSVVMGILNRTPDSFYDQGGYFGFDDFLAKADGLVAEGADLLDVGHVQAVRGVDGRLQDGPVVSGERRPGHDAARAARSRRHTSAMTSAAGASARSSRSNRAW